MLRLTDLREILRYVPQFRDKVFIIAMDGAVVEDENFPNLLLDIVLLRSLRIRVVLVHGAGLQVKRLAEERGLSPSNIDGTGVTDAVTMHLALTAANHVTHEILEGLDAHDMRGAVGNALVAHPAGILHGVDHLFTGKVDRVDSEMLHSLLDHDIVPVIPPLGWDGEGTTYRLNSDAVAVEVARAMRAAKLIFLSIHEGLRLVGPGASAAEATAALASEGGASGLIRQLSVDEADVILKKHRDAVPAILISKFEQAVRATRGGVPRIHIIDGRVEEGLLAEVFSNEGVGTLVYANEYQAIRRAQKKDTRGIFALIQAGMENDELLRRSRADIEREIEDFFVFEVDRNPAACAALHFYADAKKAELACVCVDPKYENQGIGGKLIQYAEAQARAAGATQIFCLSTQAFNYFVQKGGFRPGGVDDLPPLRRDRYERSGRHSQILTKNLS
jgi:amino-acid N-acetyltransferase